MAEAMVDLLWWVVAKAPLVLAGAALTAWVLRDASAATRHRVWATAVVMTLALPLLGVLMPRVRVDVPFDVSRAVVLADEFAVVHVRPPAGVAVQVAPGARRPVQVIVADAPRALAPRAVRVEREPAVTLSFPELVAIPAEIEPDRPWIGLPPGGALGLTGGAFALAGEAFALAGGSTPVRTVALAAWLIVATGLLLRIGLDAARTRRLARKHFDASDTPLGREVRALAMEEGGRDVRVLLGEPDAMPVTWGWVQPVLLLPAGAESWPPARLYAVARHELAHVRRGDVLLQLLADVMCALHWFNPLAWYASHRMRVERELACDDEVLAAGARPSDYASQLVGLARRYREARVAGIAMARRSGLRARIESVLDERRRRGGSRAANGAIHAVAVLFALPLAAFVPYAAADDSEPVPVVVADAPRPVATAVAMPSPASFAPRVTATRALPAQQVATLCWHELGGGSRRVEHNDEGTRLVWQRDDCLATVRVEGELRFSDDFSRIIGFDGGGYARFEERDGRRERRIEIRPDGGGVEVRWFVDGDERPFDDEAQRWLEAMLLNTFRSGGLATDERARWILNEQGIDALLEEIGYLGGDFLQGAYYRVALESPELDDQRAVRVIRDAAASIDSDHTLMQVLQTVAQRRSLADPELRAAFIEATGSIGSDHSAARVLETALTGPALPERDLAAILDAVARISSDHEQMQLLVQVATRHQLTPELRAAYLRVASTIGSDHSAGQAAAALLDGGDATPGEQALALEIATGIDSDHTRGELLSRLSRVDLQSAELRSRYEEALAGIGSDHTLGQVLLGLMRDGAVDEATAGVVLRASLSIDSDHTLGQVLTQLVRNGGLTDAMQPAFDEALATIGSDHTRLQVLEAVMAR